MNKFKQFFIDLWQKIKAKPFSFIGRLVLFILSLVIVIMAFIPRNTDNKSSAAYATDFEEVEVDYPYSYYGWFFVKSQPMDYWRSVFAEYGSELSVSSSDISNYNPAVPILFSIYTVYDFINYPNVNGNFTYFTKLSFYTDEDSPDWCTLNLYPPVSSSVGTFYEVDIHSPSYTDTVPFSSTRGIFLFIAIPSPYPTNGWFDSFIQECTIPLSTPYGYPQGYDLGYQTGLADGQSEAYNRGYEAGLRDGTAFGYSEGLKDGEEQGYSKGYNEGHSAGYSEGLQAGTHEGYQSGYNAGLAAGNIEGYNKGYDEGYSAGKLDSDSYSEGYSAGFTSGRVAGRNEALTEGLTNPVVYVLQPVVTFFDTKLFGVVSIGQILSIFIFVAVGLIFLKMFAGG